MAALRTGAAFLGFFRSSTRLLLSSRKPLKPGIWTKMLRSGVSSVAVGGAALCAVPFRQAVHTLIALQRRYLTSLGKLTPAEEDTIWQVIIGQRTEVNDRQEECKRFESTWVTAVRLCETVAEAAYTSGAEHASITARTNIQVAQTQVDEARKLSRDADQKLAETKVMEIERMAQYAASMESSGGEEEDIPDAYLRED
ncbi:diablo homolog, mitochondrial isoform X2 [Salarias fasciatus]|uniref:diablo homolog, mitochondrial isoform X2 n=1 Tax=Salarias fasciatus TaxID=181472 RepID=UPI0011769772|nr:diablo homolog, mitochondrial isoform X2 [Salarias fasciatus]